MFFKEIHHVAINASNYQATKNFYVEKLGFEGIETEPLRVDDFTGEKMTFFFDPDGLPLELHE